MSEIGALRTVVAGSQLLGFGAAQPSEGIDAGALGAPFGKSADWVRARTGITSVRRTTDRAVLPRLADRAAAAALAAAGIGADDVDLVVASCSSGAPPGASTDIARRIAPTAARMHINAACSGFCYALQAADHFIRTGAARQVFADAMLNSSILCAAGLRHRPCAPVR